MILRKIKNLIVQLILTIISFGINLIVILPIYMIFSGEWKELIGNMGMNGIVMIPVMFLICSVGFVLNRLLYRIKGKDIGDTEYVSGEEYDHTEKGYDSQGNSINIAIYKKYARYETELTAYGWLATFLAFIAFPMRLVSLAMAFIAIFSKRIFVTHRRLPSNMLVSKIGVVTHTLFDFVILPASEKTQGVKNKKSILYVVLYVVLFIVLNICALFSINLIQRSSDWVGLVSFFGGIVLLISDLILVIKHSILIVKDYDKKRGIISLIKIVAMPLIWITFNLIGSFI